MPLKTILNGCEASIGVFAYTASQAVGERLYGAVKRLHERSGSFASYDVVSQQPVLAPLTIATHR